VAGRCPTGHRHARCRAAGQGPLGRARQIARYSRFDDDNTTLNRGTIDQLDYESVLAYGFARDWVAMLHVPIIQRSFSSDIDGDTGLRDLTLMFQYRFWRRDTGAINTERLAALGGAELPSGDPSFSSETVDPFVGLAYTRITGRHGLNASALYKYNAKGLPDTVLFGDARGGAFRADASYLYRLAPDTYTADTTWSSYVQAQVLGRYETQGDAELLLAPGILFEASQWAAELTVHLPLLADLENRPEHRFAVTAGVRFLF